MAVFNMFFSIMSMGLNSTGKSGCLTLKVFFCTKPTVKVPSKLRRVLFYEVVDVVAELWFNFPLNNMSVMLRCFFQVKLLFALR